VFASWSNRAGLATTIRLTSVFQGTVPPPTSKLTGFLTEDISVIRSRLNNGFLKKLGRFLFALSSMQSQDAQFGIPDWRLRIDFAKPTAGNAVDYIPLIR